MCLLDIKLYLFYTGTNLFTLCVLFLQSDVEKNNGVQMIEFYHLKLTHLLLFVFRVLQL